VLERATGNESPAATLPGLTRDQMRRRIDKLALAGREGRAETPGAG
jgi:DNA-binding protein Fis